MKLPDRRSRTRFADPDSTVTIKPVRRGPRALAILACLCFVITLSAVLALRIVEPPTRPGSHGPAASGIPAADEAALLALPTDRLTARRLAPAPAVLVLIFPTLHAQAMSLNRVAAFVEKAGVPHDRVLDDKSLDDAIARSHDRFDTYYYGHDYRAADLARFFLAAARGGIVLRPQERALRDILGDAGLLGAGSAGALITLPPSGGGVLDPPGRATILRHEISHGVYFTEPSYVDYVRHFWEAVLSDAQRSAFRRYLAGAGYNVTDEDLMRNEAQAYLMFTPDQRFFNPRAAGLQPWLAARLRTNFLTGMAPSWLRDRGEQ